MTKWRGSKEADHGPAGDMGVRSETQEGSERPERPKVWVPFRLDRFGWVRRDIKNFLEKQNKDDL